MPSAKNNMTQSNTTNMHEGRRHPESSECQTFPRLDQLCYNIENEQVGTVESKTATNTLFSKARSVGGFNIQRPHRREREGKTNPIFAENEFIF